MAEYIELTEELKLSMCAGARAILNTKKYHGTIYMNDVFSDSPKEMPYLQAAEILYTASEKEPADVAPCCMSGGSTTQTSQIDSFVMVAELCLICGNMNKDFSTTAPTAVRGWTMPDNWQSSFMDIYFVEVNND